MGPLEHWAPGGFYADTLHPRSQDESTKWVANFRAEIPNFSIVMEVDSHTKASFLPWFCHDFAHV